MILVLSKKKVPILCNFPLFLWPTSVGTQQTTMKTTMNPIFDELVQIKKKCGLGGWTYIPVHTKLKGIAVFGSIDDYAFGAIQLMESEGQLCLPLSPALQKLLDKNPGDFVQVLLYKR